MFFRGILSFFYISFLAVLAVATPWGAPPPVTTTVTVTAPGPTFTAGGQCTTGPIQCCNTIAKANSGGFIGGLLDLLGIVVTDVTALIGTGCSPLAGIGVGGGNCHANVVCCQNNNIGGLISIGCIPIIL